MCDYYTVDSVSVSGNIHEAFVLVIISKSKTPTKKLPPIVLCIVELSDYRSVWKQGTQCVKLQLRPFEGSS